MVALRLDIDYFNWDENNKDIKCLMGSLRQPFTYYCLLAATTMFPCMCKEPASWIIRGSNLRLIGRDACEFNTTRGCQFRKRCTPKAYKLCHMSIYLG